MTRPIQQSVTLEAAPGELFDTFRDSKKHSAVDFRMCLAAPAAHHGLNDETDHGEETQGDEDSDSRATGRSCRALRHNSVKRKPH
jgi:hypothetical protein